LLGEERKGKEKVGNRKEEKGIGFEKGVRREGKGRMGRSEG